jgi:NAD(P)-dependent dehydrogenase (short-subunit alcohol dehydrogenase family)
MIRRVALVTGASRGIGLEICKQLAARGVHVVLTARNADKGQQACRQLAGQGLPVTFLALDVTDERARVQVMERVATDLGRMDVLINNAAVAPELTTPGLAVGLDLVRDTMESNVLGPLRLIQLAVPLMQRHGYGRIVNVSSGQGSFARMRAGKLGYRMSKTALNAMTRLIACELAESNILVNVMTPGWVRTHMGGIHAERSVEEGADTAVWLATLPDDGPRGRFFQDRQEIPW